MHDRENRFPKERISLHRNGVYKHRQSKDIVRCRQGKTKQIDLSNRQTYTIETCRETTQICVTVHTVEMDLKNQIQLSKCVTNVYNANT